MKYVITAGATLVLTLALVYGGCYALNRHIHNCKTCEQFNIDNFELRTFTDIKDGNAIWCSYDDKTGIKTVKFEMNIPPADFSNYISWSGFNKADSTLSFNVIPAWNDSIRALNHSLFYKRGRYNKDSWAMILDSNTCTLWAELIEQK